MIQAGTRISRIAGPPSSGKSAALFLAAISGVPVLPRRITSVRHIDSRIGWTSSSRLFGSSYPCLAGLLDVRPWTERGAPAWVYYNGVGAAEQASRLEKG